MLKNEPIYAITCMRNLEQSPVTGWPYFGGEQFMGFYHEKEIAFEDVQQNACDIQEHIYRYAVIEEITPGLYSFPRPRWFFRYDKKENRFVEIEEPAFMRHIANVL